MLYQSIDDGRGCDCGCDNGGVTCQMTSRIYDEGGCGGASATVTSGACATLGFIVRSYRLISTAAAGSCTPTGGGVTGAATAIDPVTVCCEPRRSADCLGSIA